jgi:hypothetical protein
VHLQWRCPYGIFPAAAAAAAGFSSSFLKSALPGFVSCSQHLVELLGRKADQQEVVMMHHVAILTTLEVICKVGSSQHDQWARADISRRCGPELTSASGVDQN